LLLVLTCLVTPLTSWADRGDNNTKTPTFETLTEGFCYLHKEYKAEAFRIFGKFYTSSKLHCDARGGVLFHKDDCKRIDPSQKNLCLTIKDNDNLEKLFAEYERRDYIRKKGEERNEQVENIKNAKKWLAELGYYWGSMHGTFQRALLTPAIEQFLDSSSLTANEKAGIGVAIAQRVIPDLLVTALKEEVERQRTAATTEDIVTIQRALIDLGLYLGNADGVAGPATKAAINQWLKNEGKPPLSTAVSQPAPQPAADNGIDGTWAGDAEGCKLTGSSKSISEYLRVSVTDRQVTSVNFRSRKWNKKIKANIAANNKFSVSGRGRNSYEVFHFSGQLKNNQTALRGSFSIQGNHCTINLTRTPPVQEINPFEKPTIVITQALADEITTAAQAEKARKVELARVAAEKQAEAKKKAAEKQKRKEEAARLAEEKKKQEDAARIAAEKKAEEERQRQEQEARRQLVIQIQQGLIDLGLYQGDADGKAGPATEAALNEWLEQHGKASPAEITPALAEEITAEADTEKTRLAALTKAEAEKEAAEAEENRKKEAKATALREALAQFKAEEKRKKAEAEQTRKEEEAERKRKEEEAELKRQEEEKQKQLEAERQTRAALETPARELLTDVSQYMKSNPDTSHLLSLLKQSRALNKAIDSGTNQDLKDKMDALNETALSDKAFIKFLAEQEARRIAEAERKRKEEEARLKAERQALLDKANALAAEMRRFVVANLDDPNVDAMIEQLEVLETAITNTAYDDLRAMIDALDTDKAEAEAEEKRIAEEKRKAEAKEKAEAEAEEKKKAESSSDSGTSASTSSTSDKQSQIVDIGGGYKINIANADPILISRCHILAEEAVLMVEWLVSQNSMTKDNLTSWEKSFHVIDLFKQALVKGGYLTPAAFEKYKTQEYNKMHSYEYNPRISYIANKWTNVCSPHMESLKTDGTQSAVVDEAEKSNKMTLYRVDSYEEWEEGGFKWFTDGDETIHVKYVGEVKNGMPHGLGISEPSDKSWKGEGLWKYGKMNGRGSVTGNGELWTGIWKDQGLWDGYVYRDGDTIATYTDGVRAEYERREYPTPTFESQQTQSGPPYSGEFSCEMHGSQLDLLYCFRDFSMNLSSQIKIQGQWGRDTTQIYHWQEVGNASRFDLEGKFYIHAQNVRDGTTLRLRITDNSTGKNVYDDAVGKFGVISVRE